MELMEKVIAGGNSGNFRVRPIRNRAAGFGTGRRLAQRWNQKLTLSCCGFVIRLRRPVLGERAMPRDRPCQLPAGSGIILVSRRKRMLSTLRTLAALLFLAGAGVVLAQTTGNAPGYGHRGANVLADSRAGQKRRWIRRPILVPIFISTRAATGASCIRFRATRRTPTSSTTWSSTTGRCCTRFWRKRRRTIRHATPTTQKIGDYYASCMDEGAVQRERAGAVAAGTGPHQRASPARISCRSCWPTTS